jgi:hypothetical protein
MKLNVTNTASAATSYLFDYQVGGATRLRLTAAGVLTVGTLAGLGDGSGGTLNVVSGATTVANFGNTNLQLISRGLSFGASLGAQDAILSRKGTATLQLGAADAGAVTATVTITIATPGVVTWSSHNLSTGTPVVFTTTGALPTGITAGTTYYVIAVDASTFQIATTLANALAGTAVNTSGSQSGTHTGTRYAITQRLSAQGVTGVSNIAGADMFIQGAQGTGTGAGGTITFQVAPAGSSGTAQNALQNALVVNADRSVFVPTALTVGDNSGTTGRVTIGIGTSRGLAFGNRGTIVADADGVFLLRDNAGTSFNRLSFGGSTSSFPALKRNGSTLETRLADDSGFAAHGVEWLSVTDGVTAPAAATGRARIYVDSADGDLKVVFADGTVKTIVTDT